MKAITVWQPWAWAIAKGVKPLENRTWRPPTSLIGERLAIHAGLKVDFEGVDAWKEMLARTSEERLARLPRSVTLREMPRGVIIAVARLAAVVDASEDPWFVGPFGWVLDDVQEVVPCPCRGAQGLWTVPPGVLTEVEAQIGRVS